MRTITPHEIRYALDLAGLRAPDVTFWTVREGATLVGCGALKRLDGTPAESTSMRTATDRERGGVASQLLGHLIEQARRTGADG